MNHSEQLNYPVTFNTLWSHLNSRLNGNDLLSVLYKLKQEAELSIQIGEGLYTEDAYYYIRTLINIEEHANATSSLLLQDNYVIRSTSMVDEVLNYLNTYPNDVSVAVEPNVNGVHAIFCYRNYVFSHVVISGTKYTLADIIKLPIKNILQYVDVSVCVSSLDVHGVLTITNRSKWINQSTEYLVRLLINGDATNNTPMVDFLNCYTLPDVQLPRIFVQPNSYVHYNHVVMDSIRCGSIYTTGKHLSNDYSSNGVILSVLGEVDDTPSRSYPAKKIVLTSPPYFIESKVVSIDNDTIVVAPIDTDSAIITVIRSNDYNDIHVGEIVNVRLTGGIVPVISRI